MTATLLAVTLHLNNHGGVGNASHYARDGRVGTPGIPMFPQVATPVELLDVVEIPQATTQGVLCGGCTAAWKGTGIVVRHATVGHVRACFHANENISAELAAEAPLVRAGIL